eukprot:scaffold395_cov383-Prasinococcus_capsulatus_cf.AAC.15
MQGRLLLPASRSAAESSCTMVECTCRLYYYSSAVVWIGHVGHRRGSVALSRGSRSAPLWLGPNHMEKPLVLHVLYCIYVLLAKRGSGKRHAACTWGCPGAHDCPCVAVATGRPHHAPRVG